MPDLDEQGIRVARRWAGWYLGDPGWAELIVGVYMHPDEAEKNLRVAMGEESKASSALNGGTE